MSIAFVTSAKQETPAGSCVITISPAANDYLIGVYANDVMGGTYTFGTPLVSTFEAQTSSDFMTAGIGAGKAAGSETSVTTSISSDTCVGLITSFSGVNTSTPNDATPVTGSDSLSNTSGRAYAITTTTNGAMLVFAAGLDVTATTNPTVVMSDNAGGLTWNVVYANQAGDFRKVAIAYALMPTAGAVTVTMTPSINTGFVGTLYALKPAATPVTEQEGFLFRNDDGSETTATSMAAQDTNVSAAVASAFRLRLLVNTTNDLPSTQFKLKYKKTTDSIWRDVNS